MAVIPLVRDAKLCALVERLQAEGLSMHGIAAQADVSYSTVRRILQQPETVRENAKAAGRRSKKRTSRSSKDLDFTQTIPFVLTERSAARHLKLSVAWIREQVRQGVLLQDPKKPGRLDPATYSRICVKMQKARESVRRSRVSRSKVKQELGSLNELEYGPSIPKGATVPSSMLRKYRAPMTEEERQALLDGIDESGLTDFGGEKIRPAKTG